MDFKQAYENELERADVFRRSKALVTVICLLSVALMMSLSSQNFYWAFALSICLPGYYLVMHIIFKF